MKNLIKALALRVWPPMAEPQLSPQGQLFKGVDKPTTVLANMIAADILQGKFERNSRRLKSERFEIETVSYWEPFREASEERLKSMLLANKTKASSSYDEITVKLHRPAVDLSGDTEASKILTLAVLQRAVHMREEAKLKAKFDNQQKAVDAIENWMGIKPDIDKKCGNEDCDNANCECWKD